MRKSVVAMANAMNFLPFAKTGEHEKDNVGEKDAGIESEITRPDAALITNNKEGDVTVQPMLEQSRSLEEGQFQPQLGFSRSAKL